MPTPHPDASVGAELLDVIVRLNRWVTHHSDWTLPVAQMRVLSQIDEWGEARTSDLARAERCSQPTMTARLQQLEMLGWVARSRDHQDARATPLTLTDAGRTVLADARKARARVIDTLMAPMDAPQRQRLHDATRALRELLDATYNHLPPTRRS
ncbi:MAG: MarR family transcriptional regulator [Ottowia sp.]